MLLSCNPRNGSLLVAAAALICILFTTLTLYQPDWRLPIAYRLPGSEEPETAQKEPPPPPAEPKPPIAHHPLFKPDAHWAPSNISDGFPIAAAAKSHKDLPPIPSWNRPPTRHVNESTPVFIGFTRNWPLLQQTVVSYITAGWPLKDIWVVENTGTMDANKKGKLSLQNPFYLDYYRLTKVFRVNVISTPTVLSFAQLQNFYLSTALEHDWETYFWAHQDSPLIAKEDNVDANGKYDSPYMRAVKLLWEVRDPDSHVDERGRKQRWCFRWFAYDHLTLVNRAAMEEVGGWDPFIGYYLTDCDLHERMFMAGFKVELGDVGNIVDVGTVLDDLALMYRRDPAQAHLPFAKQKEDKRASPAWKALVDKFWEMDHDKATIPFRNAWQEAVSCSASIPGHPSTLNPPADHSISSKTEVKANHTTGTRGASPTQLR